MSPAPRTTGSNALTPARGRASPMSSNEASARAIAAPRWLGAICPAATAAAIAPSASRPLRPMSADRHEVLEVRECLLADELSGAQILDRGEWLAVARGEDLGRGRRSDARERVELGGGRLVQVDRAGGRPATCGRSGAASWRRGSTGRHRIVARRDPDLIAVVERSGEVEVPGRPSRVDSRPVAASRGEQVADACVGPASERPQGG